MKPTIKETQRKPTTTAASGLTAARVFHQPVLIIHVYMDECPFSYEIQC